jgi:hypothetical protein
MAAEVNPNGVGYLLTEGLQYFMVGELEETVE